MASNLADSPSAFTSASINSALEMFLSGLNIVSVVPFKTPFEAITSICFCAQSYFPASYASIGVAKELGITTGTGNNKFNPDAEITRQDMSTLVIKAMQIARIDVVSGTAEDTKKFNDSAKISGYAIENVATMVKEGILAGNGKGIDPKGKVTRAQTAIIVYKIYNK